jgi:hypothetical protein
MSRYEQWAQKTGVYLEIPVSEVMHNSQEEREGIIGMWILPRIQLLQIGPSSFALAVEGSNKLNKVNLP